MILTVDKTDMGEHLSLICDYAKMLDIWMMSLKISFGLLLRMALPDG